MNRERLRYYISLLNFNCQENNTTCLNDISEHETSAGRDLLNVNKEMADCIGVVGQCQDLVNWLRELKGMYSSAK